MSFWGVNYYVVFFRYKGYEGEIHLKKYRHCLMLSCVNYSKICVYEKRRFGCARTELFQMPISKTFSMIFYSIFAIASSIMVQYYVNVYKMQF